MVVLNDEFLSSETLDSSPLTDTLLIEQDVNTQIREALYLVSATDVAEDPFRLIQVLLPRLEELVKCKAFTLKSAGMVVNGSVIGAGGATGSSGESCETSDESDDGGMETSPRFIRSGFHFRASNVPHICHVCCTKDVFDQGANEVALSVVSGVHCKPEHPARTLHSRKVKKPYAGGAAAFCVCRRPEEERLAMDILNFCFESVYKDVLSLEVLKGESESIIVLDLVLEPSTPYLFYL
ncbi:hypothetical protein Bca4012_019681 [Brassica carinata]